MNEKCYARDSMDAAVIRGPMHVVEAAKAEGVYRVKGFNRFGKLLWEDFIDNVVCTVGKNVMLDAALAGSSYSVTGPYMGLISSSPTCLAANTMGTHAGWSEVGLANAPTYTGNRKTVAWSAASAGAKALSAALSFAITSTGTVGGLFIVFFTSAIATKDDTGGTLYSCGAFSGGDKAVSNGDTIQASYTTSL